MKFVVRGVEERGGPLEFVHISKEEDQIGWSAVVSSCDSGDRRYRGPEMALVVGGVFDDSDGDGSEQGNLIVSALGKDEQKGLEVRENFESVPQDSFSKTEVDRPIPSNLHADETKRGDNGCGETDEVIAVRGR
ncbi:hypothetical protein A2U01_0047152 [Trifolium medium]|uniref:Uncharacterized protein n=1 Tax=Trifolium medium TaxID=97028 RepID=A0A392QNJ8_9FABA|nr:hypothetical protein [Trifolium medium]